jgi:hypothetical protein
MRAEARACTGLQRTDNRPETPKINGLIMNKLAIDLRSFECEPTVQISKVSGHWLVFADGLCILQASHADFSLGYQVEMICENDTMRRV